MKRTACRPREWASGRAARLALAFVVLAFCAAPVPGDVGGCDQRGQELDAGAFFGAKAAIDCRRCGECSLRSKACTDACDGHFPLSSFAQGCVPLVHDGEVCLDALSAASCDDYAAFVRDKSPTLPTECNFCPAE